MGGSGVVIVGGDIQESCATGEESEFTVVSHQKNNKTTEKSDVTTKKRKNKNKNQSFKNSGNRVKQDKFKPTEEVKKEEPTEEVKKPPKSEYKAPDAPWDKPKPALPLQQIKEAQEITKTLFPESQITVDDGESASNEKPERKRKQGNEKSNRGRGSKRGSSSRNTSKNNTPHQEISKGLGGEDAKFYGVKAFVASPARSIVGDNTVAAPSSTPVVQSSPSPPKEERKNITYQVILQNNKQTLGLQNLPINIDKVGIDEEIENTANSNPSMFMFAKTPQVNHLQSDNPRVRINNLNYHAQSYMHSFYY